MEKHTYFWMFIGATTHLEYVDELRAKILRDAKDRLLDGYLLAVQYRETTGYTEDRKPKITGSLLVRPIMWLGEK